jgi:hypothetical protein
MTTNRTAILIGPGRTVTRIPFPTTYRPLSDQDRRDIHAARAVAR